MKGLKADRDGISIEFNPNFYSWQTLSEALKDFGNMCIGSIKNESNFVVTLKPKGNVPRHDLERIGNEFCNYVLGLMKNRAEV